MMQKPAEGLLMKSLNRALRFPTTRRDPENGYTPHGRWIDDPYAWLERLDATETQAWIAAQEAVTHSVLRAVPGRDELRAMVTRFVPCAALTADSRRAARTRVPLAGRRQRRQAQVHAPAWQGLAARDGARPQHVGE
jgi:Prolyl oligopeptidase, N-terminal beta-propeller domain